MTVANLPRVIVMMTAGMLTGAVFAVQTAAALEPDSVILSAKAEVAKPADTAAIRLAVVADGDIASDLLVKVESEVTKITGLLKGEFKGLRIDVVEKVLQQTPKSSATVFGSSKKGRLTLQHLLLLRTEPDIQLVGRIVDAALKAGAKPIDDESYFLNDSSKMVTYALVNYEAAYAEAQKLAVDKAHRLASQAMVHTGRKMSSRSVQSVSAACATGDLLSTEVQKELNTAFVSDNPAKVEVTASIQLQFRLE